MSDADFFFILGAGVVFWVLAPILYFTIRGYVVMQRENRRLRAFITEQHGDVHGDLPCLPNRG